MVEGKGDNVVMIGGRSNKVCCSRWHELENPTLTAAEFCGMAAELNVVGEGGIVATNGGAVS